MFDILEGWNNNQVTPSLSKPHELSYRSNILKESYRPVVTSPASSLKFTFGRLGVSLQIASHMCIYILVYMQARAPAYEYEYIFTGEYE